MITAGAEDVRIARNRIVSNALHGVLITPNLSDHLWIASGNEVHDNVPGWMRGTLVGGGLAACLLILAVGAVVGGVVRPPGTTGSTTPSNTRRGPRPPL